MDNLVYVVGGNSRAYSGGGNVENFTGEATDLAHAILGLGVEYLDLIPARHGTVLGDPIFGPFGVPYALRDYTLRREGIDGAERASVVEGRERVEVAGSWIGFRNYLRSKDAV